MTNFLCIINKEMHHYFYDKLRGVCRRICRSGIWSSSETIYKEGLDGFGVYADAGGSIHLLCTNHAHEIVYLLYKNNAWHKCIITKNRADVKPLAFRIASAQGQLQLFCSAAYNDATILIHSVLSVNAMPTAIDNLQDSYYVIYGTKVYYTNANHIFGYQDFADGKPAQFVPLYQGGKHGYVCSDGTVRLNEQMLLFGDKEVYEDPYAQYPILLHSGDKLMIMWQSNEFVRYMTSRDNGETWNGPMRFVSTQRKVQKYLMQSGNEAIFLYGNHTEHDLRIFGQSDFPKPQNAPSNHHQIDTKNMELQKLKIMIEMMRAEMIQIKQQMKQLRTALEKSEQNPTE